MPRASRSLFTAALFSLSLVAAPVSANHDGANASAIAMAVASPDRSAGNRARDTYRHPVETLAFFGVEPDQTVLELFPGGGWYTEILAPLLADEGTLYAAAPVGRNQESLTKKLGSGPAAYGKVKVVTWPIAEGAISPASIDTVLTFRNVHNLVINGSAPAAFATFFSLLKPGGVLGVVDHRLPEDRDSALEKTSGYLKLSTIRKLAEDAGFVLEATSEINANPRDSADWAKGVWTLPPTLTNGDTDRGKYLAIGESDRMTLRFRKPAQ